jgi:hypothetical protein
MRNIEPKDTYTREDLLDAWLSREQSRASHPDAADYYYRQAWAFAVAFESWGPGMALKRVRPELHQLWGLFNNAVQSYNSIHAPWGYFLAGRPRAGQSRGRGDARTADRRGVRPAAVRLSRADGAHLGHRAGANRVARPDTRAWLRPIGAGARPRALLVGSGVGHRAPAGACGSPQVRQLSTSRPKKM